MALRADLYYYSSGFVGVVAAFLMLLQTNSYIVPKEKRADHARVVRKFRQLLLRLGCEHFEVYEQVGSNWSTTETTGRYVQIMRFRDRKHQQAVQVAERTDPAAQQIIAEFCELINYPYQLQQGLFAQGFYQSVMPVGPSRDRGPDEPDGFVSAMDAAEGAEGTGPAVNLTSGSTQGTPEDETPEVP